MHVYICVHACIYVYIHIRHTYCIIRHTYIIRQTFENFPHSKTMSNVFNGKTLINSSST